MVEDALVEEHQGIHGLVLGGGREVAMIEVQRDSDDVSVLISGDEVEILDAGDDYVLAECDLADLAAEAAQPFPVGLSLEIHSEDGFRTYLFHELHLTRGTSGVELAFRCHAPNRYWEGPFGLATFLAAIRDQVAHHDNWTVSQIELEDDWKGITISRIVAIGDPLHASVLAATADLQVLIHLLRLRFQGYHGRTSTPQKRMLFAVSSSIRFFVVWVLFLCGTLMQKRVRQRLHLL